MRERELGGYGCGEVISKDSCQGLVSLEYRVQVEDLSGGKMSTRVEHNPIFEHEGTQTRRSMAKFALYRKFTNSLAISVLLSIAWIGYELYFNAADPLSELWQRAWIIPAFWNLLAFVLLILICILRAPSNNPTRYAYSEETGDDLEEEGILLTGSTVILTGESATKRERKLSNADLFGLVEEVEEDKRE